MTPEGTGWAADRDVRGRSFDAVAADYAAWRPGYPPHPGAVQVGGAAGHVPPRRVLDLGAGTGRLTRPLVEAGHDVVAADVSAGMLARLADALPGVPTLVAHAESLPLPDGDVDVVVAAQAAHWFDPVAASREFRRVLRPGGAVGFVWNTEDFSAPWAAELARLLAPQTRDQHGAGPEGNRAVVAAFAGQLGADVEARTTRWVRRLPPDGVVGRAASSSRVAPLDDADRAEYLGRVRDLLAAHPETAGRAEVELAYVTTAWRLTPR